MDFGGLGHGYWTAGARILDAEQVTDIGRFAAWEAGYWAVDEASVDGAEKAVTVLAAAAMMMARVPRLRRR